MELFALVLVVLALPMTSCQEKLTLKGDISVEDLVRLLAAEDKRVTAAARRAKNSQLSTLKVRGAALGHAAFGQPSAASLAVQPKAAALRSLSKILRITNETFALIASERKQSALRSKSSGARLPFENEAKVDAFLLRARLPSVEPKAASLRALSRTPRITNEPSALRTKSSGARLPFKSEAEVDAFLLRARLPGPRCFVGSLACDPLTPFRTADGRCNNLRRPEWGSTLSTFNRLLPPVYEDAIDAPRVTGRDGSPLPSARLVSTAVHRTLSSPDPRHSHLLMQWGQFLDHDLDHTPAARSPPTGGYVPNPPDCSSCPSQGFPSGSICFPIRVPQDDPVASLRGSCLPFVRSADGRLGFGPREQLNQITAYIDASNVYGSDKEAAAALRSFRGGRLRENDEGTLPEDAQTTCKPAAVAQGHRCFRAGDARVNEQPGLISMHALWLKQHNKVAGGLARVNRRWDDDRLYQEARRIVGAQMQVITYTEFLPEVLGSRFMAKFFRTGPLMARPRRLSSYDASCDGGILNEFATAGFRFGHSLIEGLIARKSGGGLPLADHFLDPSPVSGSQPITKVQNILQGMAGQRCQRMDEQVTEAMRDRLFADSAASFGLDIVALNLQRGRDHGLPSYSEYRSHFGLDPVDSWNQMEDVMSEEIVDRLREVYASPHDVDLFTGMLAEPAVRDGLVGELCGHILGEQFRRLQNCDRFFFSHRGQAGSFDRRQLASLARTTLAKVMCDNVERAAEIPAQVFRLGSSRRPLKCRRGRGLKSVELRHWRERSGRPRRSPRLQKLPVRPRCFAGEI